jgi:hypothetical protein
MLTWLAQNKEWVFSGVGIALISVAVWLVRKFISRSRVEAPTVTHSSAISVSPSITQSPPITVAPTFNNSVVAQPHNAAFSQARYAEWKHLDTELRAALKGMTEAFVHRNMYIAGEPQPDPSGAINHGYDAVNGSLLIQDVLTYSGLSQEWDELVRYVHSYALPRNPTQQGGPTVTGYSLKAVKFLEKLGQIAREDLGA